MRYGIVIGGSSIADKVGGFVSAWRERPAEVVERYLDIPGMDGALDLTEAMTGRTAYGPKRISVTISQVFGSDDRAAAERWITEAKRWLHGRAHDFVPSWDSEYTYHGRFVAESESIHSGAAAIQFEVVCDPWKTKGERTYRVEASLGKTVVLRLGAPVVPTVTCDVPCLVNYMGETHAFGPGTSRDPGLVLRGPEAYLTVNATPDAGTAAWSAYDGLAWADFGPARVSLLATAGKPEEAAKDWLQPPFAGTWSDIDGTWAENSYATLDDPPKRNVYITYEWKDL